MKRRAFIADTAASALARPSLAGTTKTLIFVPQANLTSLDPVWTTATTTRNFATMVYETLYGRDEGFTPRPRMVRGQVIDDGKRWTMTLRDGLLWHDGTLVPARDCVASLRRWLARDAVSTTINARVDAIEAADDRTLVWRLRKPFPLLPHFLSKVQPRPVMLPERLAVTDPFKQVTEIVGCGPFRFLADAYVSGSRAAFAKFDRYTPRPEPASYAAGGRRVHGSKSSHAAVSGGFPVRPAAVIQRPFVAVAPLLYPRVAGTEARAAVHTTHAPPPRYDPRTSATTPCSR